MFIAGDKRANENPNLIAIHLLFARGHNYVVDQVRDAFPDLSDYETFQLSRHIVSAELQAVTYYSFISALTGKTLAPYEGWNINEDACNSNSFSTAAFLFGHTMLRDKIAAIKSDG